MKNKKNFSKIQKMKNAKNAKQENETCEIFENFHWENLRRFPGFAAVFLKITTKPFKCRTQHARNGHAQCDTKPNTALAQQSLSKQVVSTRPALFPSCSAPCWRSRFVVVLVSALRVPLALHACPSSVSCLTGRVVGELRALGLYVVAGVVGLPALFLLCRGSTCSASSSCFSSSFSSTFLRLSHRLCLYFYGHDAGSVFVSVCLFDPGGSKG